MALRNDLTIVESTITFLDSQKQPKKVVYNGPIQGANVLIKDLYPGATNKDGFTIFKNDLKKYEYCITDITTGAIEHSYTKNDLYGRDEVSTIMVDELNTITSKYFSAWKKKIK